MDHLDVIKHVLVGQFCPLVFVPVFEFVTVLVFVLAFAFALAFALSVFAAFQAVCYFLPLCFVAVCLPSLAHLNTFFMRVHVLPCMRLLHLLC